jgi:glycine/D-amino acid oxidase-like deaminating enzyme
LNEKAVKPTKKVDFLIVGQGIAGSVLAHRLISAGQRVFVIDRNKKSTSSRIAAGMINPVTGRKYVKSWMIEPLLEEAKKYYMCFEEEFNVEVMKEIEILRILKDDLEEERWLLRSGDHGYDQFLSEDQNQEGVAEVFNKELPHGMVQGGMQIHFPKLMEKVRGLLLPIDAYLDEEFDFQTLEVNDANCQYRHIETSHIVFCEGIRMKQNPFFQNLPMFVNKGEILKLRSDDYPTDVVAKRKHFTIPLEDGDIWFGALNSWVDEEELPSEAARITLEKELKDHYKIDFQIVDHLSAFRPAVKDRRPLLGTHPEHKRIHLFNGLGTKGASLAPYFSKVMVAYLLDGKELPQEVSIQRFERP